MITQRDERCDYFYILFISIFLINHSIMRILHISKYYYPYRGGVENICKYLVEGMTWHESAVVCFNDKRKNIVEEVNGIRVYRVASWVNISRQALSLSYFKMLHRAIREFSPDVIHFHWANPFPALVLLTMISKKVRLVVHWHMDIIKQKRIYHLIKPVETALLRRADLVVVTSPNYRDASLPLRPFKDKVAVVPNAIDERLMQKKDGDDAAIREIQASFGGKPIVFFVGRHIQYKGLPYLIEAARYVKSDCKIVIAGDGPLTNELKTQCKSDKVTFVGRLTDEKLRLFHYAAKVFAFPSITKNEAFGVALAEAMYAGTPAVTFTIEGSGVNWVSKNNETCLEVENGNARAFAEAIDRLLTDEALWQRLSQAGIRRVKENFTIPVMCEEMEKQYEIMTHKMLTKVNLEGGVKCNLVLHFAAFEERRAA